MMPTSGSAVRRHRTRWARLLYGRCHWMIRSEAALCTIGRCKAMRVPCSWDISSLVSVTVPETSADRRQMTVYIGRTKRVSPIADEHRLTNQSSEASARSPLNRPMKSVLVSLLIWRNYKDSLLATEP